jgi:prepilin-type N-terminal cleavage/methylation domain-containing protein
VRTSASSRGYSIMELLVVVAIIGIVTLVAVPAMLQLMPQYRIRSAASETAANMRMIRQRAIATRTPHRVSFDFTRNRYYYSFLNTPNADLTLNANWTQLAFDGRNPAPGNNAQWVNVTAVQLTGSTNSFKDVVCIAGNTADGYVDLIYMRDGSVSNKQACGAAATTVLTFSPAPAVVFSVDSSYVAFNRYTISVEKNGRVTITPSKV